MNTATSSNKPQKARLAKRMGVSETTTESPVTQLTTSSTNAEKVWRRAQHLQSGTKGRSRFGRHANNERNAIKAFFERYKYAQSSTEVPSLSTSLSPTITTTTTEKPTNIAASGSAPVLTFTTINDNSIRHHKHHRA